MGSGIERLVWLGHATVALQSGRTRLLTDPVLGRRLLFLRRHSRRVPPDAARQVAGVLVSHMHFDHLDLASLRRIGRDVPVVVPAGAGGVLARRGFADVTEVAAGDELALAGIPVRVVPAVHDDRRYPRGPTAHPVGYVTGDSPSVYFAGDTDLYADIRRRVGHVDIALVPIWGWGASIGPGHMGPREAAEALALLRPAMAVPIHWGTLLPIGFRYFHGGALVEPARAFVRAAAELAPDVEVHVLEPGAALPLGVGADTTVAGG